jgi:hypothetical protein
MHTVYKNLNFFLHLLFSRTKIVVCPDICESACNMCLLFTLNTFQGCIFALLLLPVQVRVHFGPLVLPASLVEHLLVEACKLREFLPIWWSCTMFTRYPHRQSQYFRKQLYQPSQLTKMLESLSIFDKITNNSLWSTVISQNIYLLLTNLQIFLNLAFLRFFKGTILSDYLCPGKLLLNRLGWDICRWTWKICKLSV